MTLADLTVGEFLDSLAAPTPTPGGGAAAALTAALAAALGEMVVHLAKGKPSSAEQTQFHDEALQTLAQLRTVAANLVDSDAQAFQKLWKLWKLKPDDDRRRTEWAEAVAGAIDAPKRTIETSLDTLHLLQRLVGGASASLRSDLAVAALLGQTAARAAAWNVRINLPLLKDPAQAERLEAETAGMLEQADRICATIERDATPSRKVSRGRSTTGG